MAKKKKGSVKKRKRRTSRNPEESGILRHSKSSEGSGLLKQLAKQGRIKPFTEKEYG